MNRNGFDIGEYVSYGINGMCNIEDIRPMQLSQSVEKMMYYILRPELQSEIDDICSGK